MSTATAPALFENLGHALSTDYFFLREQLADEELDVLRRVREFVDDEVLPVIGGFLERAEVAWPLIRPLRDLRVVGEGSDPSYGCPVLSPSPSGLVAMELNPGGGDLAGLNHGRRRLRAGRESPSRSPDFQGRRPRPREYPQRLCVGGARACGGGLRRSSHLLQAPRTVRTPAVQLPDRPGPSRQDARRDHRDAALLLADRTPGRAGAADAHDRRAGEAQQHAQGPPDLR